ncbi:uncharacterized protein LOC121046344 [Ixodes scapularis]|uniref:uncharacterized protein LOC121046344 n=1 Tax=Ixodes scapularis TaxID=6945 RepID=UPI001AD7DB0D|nr:uncharacterized protein LOC121046344 [Ixodes scapularis]
MEKPSKTCPVGDACMPVQGAEAPPFVEGDQALLVLDKDKPAALDMNEPGCPNRKLTEILPDDKMVEYRGDDEISPLYRRSPAQQDRSPGYEEVGDKARPPVSVARPGHELSLDPTIIRFISSDAALDEGYMVSELLKKGRLKNSTITEKGLILQEGGEAHSQNPQAKKQISVLLEATQNITLRYQVVGTTGNTTGNTLEDKSESRVSNIMQPRQMRETAADLVSKSPRALSSSDEMLYFKEKVRTATGPVIERKGASCSRLHIGNCKVTPSSANGLEKTLLHKKISKSALPPAYSPSQLNISKVKSQIAELTLKKSSQLSQASFCRRKLESDNFKSSGTADQPNIKQMSKITQIVISKLKPATNSSPTDNVSQSKEIEPKSEQLINGSRSRVSPKGELTKSSTDDERYLPRNSRERPSPGIKDMPLLEVLEKSEFPVSSTEKAKRRVKRYYRREEDFFSGSPSLSSTESLVQLDLSNIPTETSELAGYHCQRQEASGGSGADNVEESSTSWYSFDSENRESRRSEVALCDTKGSESSWRSYMKGHTTAPELNMSRLASLFSDAFADVQRISWDQNEGSLSGAKKETSSSGSTSSLNTVGSCDSGDGDTSAVSRTETAFDRENAPNENEKNNFKASSLIRYFESIQ